MKAIAFYLPQYHIIPENEAIYGKGFTEWDNVRAARPLFAGHEQPQFPHPSVGFYDLLDESFLVRQHALAYQFGVTGFCYYYYNIAGRRLLEKPLELILRNELILSVYLDQDITVLESYGISREADGTLHIQPLCNTSIGILIYVHKGKRPHEDNLGEDVEGRTFRVVFGIIECYDVITLHPPV